MLCWCCVKRFGPATERETKGIPLLFRVQSREHFLWFCILEWDRELLSVSSMDVGQDRGTQETCGTKTEMERGWKSTL